MMKKYILAVCLLLGATAMRATDQLTAYASGSNLYVALTNDASYVAMQADITLPSGVSIESGDEMTDNLASTARSTAFSFYCRQTDSENNVYRIVAYNLSNTPISGLSQLNILNITLSASASADGITLSNVKLATSGLTEETLTGEAVAQGNLGDVNNDDKINLLDVLAITDLQTNGVTSETTYTVHNADLDSSGDLDTDDLTAITINL